MDERITVTDLDVQGKLTFIPGRYNIINCGTRTGKTYWAMHNLCKYTRDGNPHRILFLTDTLALKNSIIEQYGDYCCDGDDTWRRPDNQWWDEKNDGKIGIMCYQGLGARVLKEDVEFLSSIDVICWDECDSIFDFAATAFAQARKYDFAKKSISNEEILSVIQQYSTKNEYLSLILLGFWEKIINEQRILCIGLSATPERAIQYYAGLISASNTGRLATNFRAAADIYFKNAMDLINSLTPMDGVGYFMYSPRIQDNQAFVRAANVRGFSAIEIHSPGNEDNPMNEEQLRTINMITNLHIVPYEYNFVVVTKAFERGLDILDHRFRNLIVDSYRAEDREQAARQCFPYQRYVKTLTSEVPSFYRDRWLTVQECKELAEEMSIPDIRLSGEKAGHVQPGRFMSWNKLQKLLEDSGYAIEKSRKRLNGSKNALNCYKITGEWHDVEIHGGGDFMQLVEAKMALVENSELDVQ